MIIFQMFNISPRFTSFCTSMQCSRLILLITAYGGDAEFDNAVNREDAARGMKKKKLKKYKYHGIRPRAIVSWN